MGNALSVLECPTSEEHVVLLDGDYKAIGTLAKAEAHTGETPLHLAFSLFLLDSEGRLLVQRRALSKKTWAGVWSNSCCGHPSLGESIEEAVYRRTQYELGIELGAVECILPAFRYRAKWNGVWENELCPVWVGFCETTPEGFEPLEVEEVSWISWSEFSQASQLKESHSFSHYSPWSLMEARELEKSSRFRELFAEWTIGSEMEEERMKDVV